uniref:BACK domain-containing protein n=1 Tax=Parascaris univalens TaxID=6257 RepID=A0A914ZZP1_PARUN
VIGSATSPGVLRLMASAASSGGKKTVVIRSHKNNFVLEVDIFAKYSDVIKKLQQANKLPATLDLSNYAVTAVSTLCDFINDTGRANARITTLVLGDLMELSGILQIGVLRQKIDRFVIESAENSPRFVIHALTILCNSRDLIESQLGQRIVDIAAEDFGRISKISSFNEIPGDVVLRLFDRCDLPVESEYELAEVAVKWLASKPERVQQAYRVLRCIRVTNLTVDQRKQLDALSSSMPQCNATVFRSLRSENMHMLCKIHLLLQELLVSKNILCTAITRNLALFAFDSKSL